MLVTSYRDYRVYLQTEEEVNQVSDFIQSITAAGQNHCLSVIEKGYILSLRELKRIVGGQTLSSWLKRHNSSQDINSAFRVAVMDRYDTITFVSII